MLEREKLINLYEIYMSLLTENQRNYFESYYFEDLSLSEISENKGVSKSFVSKTINTIETKLKKYENSLKILTLHTKISQIAKITTDKTTKEELENLTK